MIHFDLPKQKSSIIKVIGVGGGGSNAVNYMHSQSIDGVDFIVCNTDAKAIELSTIPNKIQLGPYLTQGLGAGANPEIGKRATEESLEEIKKILEVNTKMAFITVGMGGGTGTGGAPIIAKACKELGILTVGIVTTPFSFEGPRRLAQAQEGINQLKPYVDTLLVISNDKLRVQYGNLKMREAFSKADNVLGTAAKCITDIINSRGHVIVDFADVCTVMQNGGSAILGKAEVEGEDRAQRAIEEALSSPLLNDSEIKGARWILINIYSAEGEHELTMDEIDTINTYLRMQAGENTDVIFGTGYDNSLDKKIGITLIATGFESKDPFAKAPVVVKQEPAPQKIVIPLKLDAEEVVNTVSNSSPVSAPVQPTNEFPTFKVETTVMPENLNPTLSANIAWEEPTLQEQRYNNTAETNFSLQELNATTPEPVHFELNIASEEVKPIVQPEKKEVINEQAPEEALKFNYTEKVQTISTTSILHKPTTIYAQPEIKSIVAEEPKKVVETTAIQALTNIPKVEEQTEAPLQSFTVYEKPSSLQAPEPVFPKQELAELDEVEEQRKKALDRIKKLRSLSFNTNSADPNNEFDTVPAYIRQKMELFGNAFTSAENFYSNLTVGKDESNQPQISSINSFLEGKKPD